LILSDTLVNSVREKIELSWVDSAAWPEYIEAVRLAVNSAHGSSAPSSRDFSNWALLPGLCCQAAGGDPYWADDIAAAWILLYLAADLMDSVEDGDEPDPWWRDLGPGAAINVATGLFFSGSRALNRLYDRRETSWIAGQLVEDFHNCFLVMCSGQHLDLTVHDLDLEKYWKIAQAKSGAFFEFACRAGASLVTDNPGKLGQFSDFGKQVGMLVQIMDDLEELQDLREGCALAKRSRLSRSLPVIYALEVLPGQKRRRLQGCLDRAIHDLGSREEAFSLIEQCGVILYLYTVIEHHKSQALVSLEAAKPQYSAGETLSAFLQRFDLPI
jgi:geranylgeranyl pyrophosphate synthase